MGQIEDKEKDGRFKLDGTTDYIKWSKHTNKKAEDVRFDNLAYRRFNLNKTTQVS